MPAPKIAGTIRSKNPLKGAVEILPERLYFAALKQPPPSHNILASTPPRDPTIPKGDKKQIHFFNVDQELVYWNFFLDFGPLNLGQMTRFCFKLNDKLRKFPVVCFYSNTQPAKRTNAVFLICAWQVLFLQRTPAQAFAGFHQPGQKLKDGGGPSVIESKSSMGAGHLQPNSSWPPVSQSQGAPTIAPLPPFHDASNVACTYDLTVVDCLEGMVKAMQFGFWNIHDFDLEEYEHFEQVENGDLNWIVKGRILAFAGPSYQRYVSPEGYCTLSPDDYIPYFKEKKVDLVVRLNKKNYHERDFQQAGIRHVEHFFVDGSCPSMRILNNILQDFEAVPQDRAFAVHCKAGLGRTGTCIGAYLMKHYRFTAAEVIGWMRLCRPGCVIGPQQQFLQTIQSRMWQAGMSSKPVPRNRGFFKSSSQGDNEQGDNDNNAPDSPRMRLSRDAVEGRAGQGESLLAARRNRPGASHPADSPVKATFPTPPITPETKERRSAVVTPDESAAAIGVANDKTNLANNSGAANGVSCNEAIANSGVCGDSWLS